MRLPRLQTGRQGEWKVMVLRKCQVYRITRNSSARERESAGRLFVTLGAARRPPWTKKDASCWPLHLPTTNFKMRAEMTWGAWRLCGPWPCTWSNAVTMMGNPVYASFGIRLRVLRLAQSHFSQSLGLLSRGFDGVSLCHIRSVSLPSRAPIIRTRTTEHTMHCLSETRALPWHRCRADMIVSGAKQPFPLVPLSRLCNTTRCKWK